VVRCEYIHTRIPNSHAALRNSNGKQSVWSEWIGRWKSLANIMERKQKGLLFAWSMGPLLANITAYAG
jgi:hypothetical protein